METDDAPRSSPGLGQRCFLVSAELALDVSQPALALPQLGLGEPVSVLWVQGVTQLLQSLQAASRLRHAAAR